MDHLMKKVWSDVRASSAERKIDWNEVGCKNTGTKSAVFFLITNFFCNL